MRLALPEANGAPLARPADRQELDSAEAALTSVLGPQVSQLILAVLATADSGSQVALLPQLDGVRAAMRQSREILDQVIARSQQGMSFYDRDLRLVTWNQAGLDIFELPENIFHVGARLDEVIRACAERGLYGPGRVDDLAASRVAAILDAGSITRTRSMNGSKIFDMRSVRMPDGGLLVLNFDVTQQAATEEQLEAENETLERRVRERTEQLESLNAAYAKAKAEAEEANISKTRFLAAASHDLLQPLNAARLYATSLKERVRAQSPADDSLALALNVEESLEAVEDMLNALLDISHLDAGAMKTDISAFRVDDIFRTLQREFEPSAAAKGLALRFIRSSIPVESDSRLLRRLLQNLVSNAIKYTVEGRVIVGVRRGAKSVRIEVWDTGLGIPKSKQADVFREFERLPSAIMTAPGVGLGLSIVERLSRVLDHEIRIRSKPGRGSVFTVVVPRATTLPLPAAISQGMQGRPRSLDGLVVVAIDNEPAILKGMDALLRGWDCTIIVGTDRASVEAILVAQGLIPDVIIADLHVGAADGLAAVAALRARFGRCQAVLVTADRSPLVRSRSQEADVRLLNKPVKPAALRSLLSQWHLVKQATH
ncbi:ATP-binding protein [Beijerinckia sp. L45]|uniref:ATP-binding response regulator n=1 Tax=Beijerinckia sp. L45 TaxID=1641855 RepID=UPI00131C2001|nr:ATP-binding protein [Beijerinckia sp. L45]